MASIHLGRRRILVGVLSALAVVSPAFPTGLTTAEVSAASATIATTTTLQLPSHELLVIESMEFTATVQPAPATGEVWVYDVTGGGHQFVSANTVEPATGIAYLMAGGPSLGLGQHELVAVFTDPQGNYDPSTSTAEMLDVVKAPITLSLSTSGTTMYPGDSLTLTAKSTDAYAGGVVTFTSAGPSGDQVLGSGPLFYSGTDYRFELPIASLALGQHVITASIPESDTTLAAISNTVTVTSAKRPTTTTINAMGTPQTHHPFEIYVYPAATVYDPDLPVPTGSVTLKDGAVSLGTKSLVNGSAIYQIASFTAGTHALSASYTGNAQYAPSSTSVPLVIKADVVEITSVGVQYATFYPVTDGYRDSVAIKGDRLEPSSVAIRIFDPWTSTTVRTASVPIATGKYSYVWNGRTSSGVILPAGYYTVAQTFTDGFGTKQTVNLTVRLLPNELVTKTAYVTLAGSSLAAKGSGGGGSVSVSTSGGYAKLAVPSGWAAAGWQFRIPDALIYKSVSIEIDAKAPFSVPPSNLGIQNFQTCSPLAEWNVSCFERWKTVGSAPLSRRWYATEGSSSSAYRSRGIVRGLVYVQYGTVYVYQARAKVVYQVLDPPVGRISLTR
jgi:hypothetical protein